MDNSDLISLCMEFIGGFENCHLKAYPDPKWHGIKRTEKNWDKWGKPWTIGWGETKGVKEGDVWSQEYADTVFRKRAAYFLKKVYGYCPQLYLEPWDRVIACVSLAYNIGAAAFGASSVCRRTRERNYKAAERAFWLWNKAGGRVLRGLTKRRKLESIRYMRCDS